MTPARTIFAGALIGAVLAVFPANAALRLSAGEHGAYSRIAIPYAGDGPWTSAQNGRAVRITLPGLTGPFDTRAIFPRRAAHRVLNVAVSQGGNATILTFKLACACAARVYRWKGGKLLMDIRDVPAALQTVHSPAKTPDPSDAPAMNHAVEPLDIEKTRLALMERLQAAADAGVVQMERAEAAPPAQDNPPPRIPHEAMDTEPAPSPMMAADPVEPQTTEMAVPVEAPMDGPMEAPVSSAQAPSHGAPPTPRETIAQAIVNDRPPATDIMFGQDVVRKPHRHCLSDNALRLGSWRSQVPFSRELAQKRAALLGEFDAPDIKAGIALAEFYLAYGLGDEAALIVTQIVGEGHPKSRLITDLANIFRGRMADPDGPILGAGSCEGAHALWQAAARALNEEWQDAAKAENRTGDALAQLPRNLRIPLGVTIAQAALNAGKMEQVRRILALLRRSGKIKSPALDLVAGKFAQAENLQSRAHDLLDPLSVSTHPEAVEATLALSRAELVTPGYLSEERLVDLALIAMERRYTALGREALILTAWAETAAGRPGMALDILSREADSSSLPSQKLELHREIAQTLLSLFKPDSGKASLQNADLFWQYESYLDNTETTRTIRRGVARYLLAKGLPNAAIPLLRRPGTEAGPPLLLAEALIAVNRPAQALETLNVFSDDPLTVELRSTALAHLGRYREAAGLIPDTTRDPRLLTLKAGLLWSDGQWEQAARLYARLAGALPPPENAAMARRLTAATYMAENTGLTGDTLSLLKTGGNEDLMEILTPTLSPSLPLPERVDQSLETAQTVTRILKELLADG